MSETEARKKSDVFEIDLNAIAAIFWRRRKLICFGTLAATLLAAVISFLIPETYRSEGFYQLGNPQKREKIDKKKKIKDVDESEETMPEQINDFSGISIPLYKKSASQFFNPDYFYQSARVGKYFNEKDLHSIKLNFQTGENLKKWITPVFAYAKADSRTIALLPKNKNNSVLGLNLSYEADSAQKAYDHVHFFGQYVRDCFFYVTLYDYVKDEYSKVISEVSQNENDIIDLQFSLLQNTKKILAIKAILATYPEAAKIENRQMVLVEKGSFRFLAPVTQLVGIESTLVDQRLELAGLERKKEKLLMRKEYFSRCNDLFNDSGKNGEQIFAQLKALKAEVFKDKDSSKDTAKAVANDLRIDRQAFELAFFSNCRFISGPTLPVRPIKPQKRLIVILTCFLAFFFFIFLTLVLHWWQSNKKEIKGIKI